MDVKLFIALFTVFPTAAVWCKEFYTAAVFEHRPRGERDADPSKIVSANLNFYEKATHLASAKGADIIVFNEFGIHPYNTRKVLAESFNEPIPDPMKANFNPCVDGGQNMPILSALSCMAKRNNIYVVANMGDVQPCEGTCNVEEIEECDQKCPDDNVLLYNTNVVFDRAGNLIAKYHKNRPYTENLNSPDPEDPEYVTFRTDFGTFGVMICFDSVFEPSKILVEEHGIDTIVFPTFWFDDILPLNTVEWQQSWAIAHKVNFLASNTQTSGNGSLGSGIYSRNHGAIAYSYEPDGESKLLVARIPLRDSKISLDFEFSPSITVIEEDHIYLKEEAGEKFPLYGYINAAGPINNHYSDYRVYKHQTEKYTLNKLVSNVGNIRACNNEFCCQLQYETADVIEEDFYLAAFNGLNNVRNFFYWYEEVCMLIRCDAFDDKPCVLQPSRSKTVFKSLSIAADFKSETVFPTVTKNKFRLVPTNEWNFERQGSKVVLNFEGEEPLLKAGLLGRCYERDPPFIPWYKY